MHCYKLSLRLIAHISFPSSLEVALVHNTAVAPDLASAASSRRREPPHSQHGLREVVEEDGCVEGVGGDEASDVLCSAGHCARRRQHLIGRQQAFTGEQVYVVLVVESGRRGQVQVRQSRPCRPGAQLLKRLQERQVLVGPDASRDTDSSGKARAEGRAPRIPDGVRACVETTRLFV
jgi:hypothetical protein